MTTLAKGDVQDTEFQSTLPQGKWRRTVQNGGAACQFQSTLPQGKWQILLLYPLIYYQISIHTSAREVTKLQFGLTQQNIISIHTSAREVTVISFCISQSTFISIHTSAREVTLISFRIPSAFGFQSTLPQGKWLHNVPVHSYHKDFNPHFRKGSDFHSLWSIYNL